MSYNPSSLYGSSPQSSPRSSPSSTTLSSPSSTTLSSPSSTTLSSPRSTASSPRSTASSPRSDVSSPRSNVSSPLSADSPSGFYRSSPALSEATTRDSTTPPRSVATSPSPHSDSRNSAATEPASYRYTVDANGNPMTFMRPRREVTHESDDDDLSMHMGALSVRDTAPERRQNLHGGRSLSPSPPMSGEPVSTEWEQFASTHSPRPRCACLWNAGRHPCQFVSDTRSVKRHIESVHLRIKPHVCEYCDRPFALLTNREVHKRIHIANPLTPYPCTVEPCKELFADISSRRHHELRAHSLAPEESTTPPLNY